MRPYSPSKMFTRRSIFFSSDLRDFMVYCQLVFVQGYGPARSHLLPLSPFLVGEQHLVERLGDALLVQVLSDEDDCKSARRSAGRADAYATHVLGDLIVSCGSQS